MAVFAGSKIKSNNIVAYYDPFNKIFSTNGNIKNIYNTEELLILVNAALENNYIKFLEDNSVEFNISSLKETGTLQFQVIKDAGFTEGKLFSKYFSQELFLFENTDKMIVSITWDVTETTEISLFINDTNIKEISRENPIIPAEGPIIIKSVEAARLGFIRYYDIRISQEDVINNFNATISRKF
jgi:hypothetical protein